MEPAAIWVPSEENPADDPTRGARLRKACQMDESMKSLWTEAMEDGGWAACVTRLHWEDEMVPNIDVADLSERDQWWRMTYDTTYGYPGEGPPRQKGRSERTADLRTRVQPVTEERYRVRLSHVETWMRDQGLPSVGELSR
eukprot:772177-Amphidinium_carterae.4